MEEKARTIKELIDIYSVSLGLRKAAFIELSTYEYKRLRDHVKTVCSLVNCKIDLEEDKITLFVCRDEQDCYKLFNILNSERFTIDYHIELGKTLGYPDEAIEEFLNKDSYSFYLKVFYENPKLLLLPYICTDRICEIEAQRYEFYLKRVFPDLENIIEKLKDLFKVSYLNCLYGIESEKVGPRSKIA